MTTLEEEFRKAYLEGGAKIKQHLKNIEEELKKAIAIAEEYGIPFDYYPPGMTSSGTWYCPESFKDKWEDYTFIENLGDFEDENSGLRYGVTGWMTSYC